MAFDAHHQYNVIELRSNESMNSCDSCSKRCFTIMAKGRDLEIVRALEIHLKVVLHKIKIEIEVDTYLQVLYI